MPYLVYIAICSFQSYYFYKIMSMFHICQASRDGSHFFCLSAGMSIFVSTRAIGDDGPVISKRVEETIIRIVYRYYRHDVKIVRCRRLGRRVYSTYAIIQYQSIIYTHIISQIGRLVPHNRPADEAVLS